MASPDFQTMINQVRGLDLQNPGSWPDWVRIATAVLLVVVLVGGSYWYLIKPRYEAAATAERQETQLRRDFETKQRRAASLDAYRARLEEMEREFGQMLRQLPSRAEVANLLNDISQTRAASNLDEELFEPQPELVRDFYAELPHRIVVLGGYHDLGRFVSNVAALSRIVTIEEVEIAPMASGRGEEADGNKLRMSATAKTYRYLDEDELAAQRAAEAERRRSTRRR